MLEICRWAFEITHQMQHKETMLETFPDADFSVFSVFKNMLISQMISVKYGRDRLR